MSSGRRPIRLAHTSDVHLGSSHLAREEMVFERFVSFAVDQAVDAVLIAGDLFDHARVGDELLDWTAGQLDRLSCPVVLHSGNHDLYHDLSVYHRFKPESRCPHVRFIDDHDGRVVDLADIDTCFWGRAMEEHEPAFRPVSGVPDRPDDRWSVIVAHGLMMEDESSTYRSSPIYPSDFAGLDWDYVALGHVHAHRVMPAGTMTACYPGATAWSRGGEPGAVIVDFAEGRTPLIEWHALS